MSDDEFGGTPIGNPAGFIRGSILDGLSARASLAAFREAGGAMRDEYFRQLYGEITNSIARSPAAAALDPFSIPNASDYATWSMGSGGQFATQVQVLFRDKDTGIIGSKEYTYVTDYAHTPAEAMQAGIDEFGDVDDVNEYEQVMYGSSFSNVFQTQAWNP